MQNISVASKRIVQCHGISNKSLPSTAQITKEILNSFMTEAVCKSMDWFLYDNDLCHKRVKYCSNARKEYNFIWIGLKGRRLKSP